MNKLPLLQITNLHTHFKTHGQELAAIKGISLEIYPGETLALVGESGSGKSVTSLSIMQLLPKKTGFIRQGEIRFRGKSNLDQDLCLLDEEGMRHIRGFDIGMVFQEPMTSLNPVYTVGDQIAEPLKIHLGLAKHELKEKVIDLLMQVGIPDPDKRLKQYPHELSGGMRQRVTIAMALACSPSLIIADEPTTALDVTIQAQILDLFKRLQQQNNMGLLFVTHNLGVVAELADRVAVMYAGQIVEQGTVSAVFKNPQHPYTVGLLKSLPRLGQASEMKKNATPLYAIAGMVPSLANLPQGCAFEPRCTYARGQCKKQMPNLLVDDESGAKEHLVRCFHSKEIQYD